MKQLSYLFAMTILASAGFSQDARVARKIVLKVEVKDSIHRVDFGYLEAMADSGIVMVKSPVIFDHSLSGTNANVIVYKNLSEVKIHRKGSVGRGMLIGSLSGMVVGGIVGLISYKKPSSDCYNSPYCITWDFGPGYDALGGALIGTVAGAAIGGVLGALAKKKFIIGGNRNKFLHMKENVLDMTYRNNHQQ